jgi:6-phosphogluconolactonase
VPELHVYVGTYTSSGGEGIYLFAFDPATGALSHRKTIIGAVNPSFLALGPRGRPQGQCLYTVNEVDTYYGRPEGALSAFSIEPGSGDLRFLNQQPSRGASPCHISLDQSGRYLFAANYGGGSVAVFPLRGDGGLEPASCDVAHKGSGPNTERQQGPHAHCVVADPFNRHLLAVDLGCDGVMAYPFDPERGALRAAPRMQAKPGSGPRQLAFHPNGRWAYVVHELEPRLTLYHYNGMTGSLSEAQSVSCLPAGVDRENYASTIQVDAKGRFLYVSNRGHDSIAHFRIDEADGTLAFAGSAPTRGRYPRHFTLDPEGRFLFAANQRSDSLVVFRVDAVTGDLEGIGSAVTVPAPVCVVVHAP